MFGSDTVFARFMNRLCDILFVGILWLLFSLPLVTAGTAATAAYYAMAKCVRFRTGYISREFWHSFRQNCRQMIPLTCVFLAVAAVLAIDIRYVWNNDSTFNSALFMVLLFVAFLALGLYIYSCPLLSRFEKKNLELIRLSAVVMFRYLPVTVGVILAAAAACAAVYLMPWAVLVIPGVFMMALTYPMEWIMGKLMPPAPEDDEESKKWYYRR